MRGYAEETSATQNKHLTACVHNSTLAAIQRQRRVAAMRPDKARYGQLKRLGTPRIATPAIATRIATLGPTCVGQRRPLYDDHYATNM